MFQHKHRELKDILIGTDMSKENVRGSKTQFSYLFQRRVSIYQPKHRPIHNIPLQPIKVGSQGGILGKHLILDETAQLNRGRWELLSVELACKGFKYRVA